VARQPAPDREQPRPGEPSAFSRSLAEFVRARRAQNRLSQTDLALMAGVGRRFVSDLENGKPTLRLQKVDAVLRVFGMRLGVVRREVGSEEARG
jgi:y4mF family transcriptional regulator